MAEPHSSREEAAALFRADAGRRVAWIAALVLAPTAAYFALFAWDHERDIVGDETSGPYAAWQILLLVALLLVLVVESTRRRMAGLATVVIPVVLTFWFAQDWAQSDDSGLFAVGVGLLATGSLIGVALTSALARSYFGANPEDPSEPAPRPGPP